MDKGKILVICGATATGKTDLAVSLSKRFSGEIVSADSRQVYKGMDIGTGKDLNEKDGFIGSGMRFVDQTEEIEIGYRKKDGIPVWLVDMVAPGYRMNVGEYAKAANLVIRDILQRNKLPILAGGTGLYIKAVTEDLDLINIPPDEKLRNMLNKFDRDELGKLLSKEDPEKYSSLNESDVKNPRRLIRAIEIAYYRKKRGNIKHLDRKECDYLLIGLKSDPTDMNALIKERIKKRLEKGMIGEIKILLEKEFSFQSPGFSSIGYPLFQNYIENEYRLTPKQKDKMITDICKIWLKDETSYAKRQSVWLNKQRNIKWFSIRAKDYMKEIFDLVGKWYTSY